MYAILVNLLKKSLPEIFFSKFTQETVTGIAADLKSKHY